MIIIFPYLFNTFEYIKRAIMKKKILVLFIVTVSISLLTAYNKDVENSLPIVKWNFFIELY